MDNCIYFWKRRFPRKTTHPTEQFSRSPLGPSSGWAPGVSEKTQVGRVVSFSDDAREALQAWLAERDPHQQQLFHAWGRDSLSYTAARVIFLKYLTKAGLSQKGYSLHSLRHTFASELLNAGLRLDCLQQWLGHAKLD